MTDVLDETVSDILGDKDDEPGGESPALFVCPYESDGKVCGRSFDKLVSLNAHTMRIHSLTHDGKPVKPSGRKRKDAEPDDAPTTKTASPKVERKAAAKATGHPGPAITDSNRAAIYGQSLATVGLLAHLAAGRWFDNYDLDVWSNGSQPLANALDAVGEQNPGMRKTCDMLLAGGTGGAYVQLILASAMIAVPIAAHHGWLPAATGERFGAMLNVMAPPTPGQPESGATVPTPDADGTVAPASRLPVSEWSYDEWREVLFAAPQTVNGQRVMLDMMQGGVASPTEVRIPDMPGTEPMTIPTEEHRGSIGTDNGAEDSASAESVPA